MPRVAGGHGFRIPVYSYTGPATTPAMVEVTFDDGRLTGTDPAGNTAAVDLRGWEPRDPPYEFEERVTTVGGGVTSAVGFPHWSIGIRPLDDGVDLEAFAADTDDGDGIDLGASYGPEMGTTAELPAGSYQIRSRTQPLVFLRFDAAATVSVEQSGASVSFDAPTTVAIGFRSTSDFPDATVRVPRTPAGVATALGTFSAALRTTSPDASFPTMRAFPPLVEFGEESVPESVRDRVPAVDAGIESPPAVAELFAVAPLATYTGASVTVADREAVTVRLGDTEHRLPPAPAVAPAARRLLHRLVGFDCLVRNAGEYGSDLAEFDALPDGIAEDWYDAPPAARFERYLAEDLDPTVEALPPFHYTATVEPAIERAPLLPHLQNDLCPVRLPGESAGEGPPTRAHATHALVGAVDRTAVATDDDDIAVEGRPAAYPNRLREGPAEPRVVCTSPDRDDTAHLERAAGNYRQREQTEPSVGVEAGVDRDDLEATLEERTSAVQYVGDCDPDRGLRCADGWLDPGSVAVGAGVVLLDAPRSLDAARTLVDRGAVAVVCTDADDRLRATPTLLGLVLDKADVGTATALARTHDAVADHVRVVGDGSYSAQEHPFLYARVSKSGQSEPRPFRYELRAISTTPGTVYTFGNSRARLGGNSTVAHLSVETLRETLADGTEPTVQDGTVYWPETADRLLYPFA